MKISIANYKSLKNFEYEIQDNKINFLFGLSGTGKSSISEALLDKHPIDNQCFRSIEKPIIKINSLDPKIENIYCFNNESVNVFVEKIDCNDQKVKKIFIDDDMELENAQIKLNEIIKDLQDEIDNSKNTFEKAETFAKTFLSSKYKKNITQKMPISRLENVVNDSKQNGQKVLKEIVEMPGEKLAWIITGYNNKIDNNCPFCGKKMGKRTISKIEKMSKYDEGLIKNTLSQNEFNKKVFNREFQFNKKEVNKLKENSIITYNACLQFINIQNKVDDLYKTKVGLDKIDKILIDNDFKKIFPKLYNEVDKYNKHISHLKNILNDARKKTKKVLSRNLTKVNGLLRKFNLPYIISAEIHNKLIEDYKITHIDDENKKDDTKCLSCGEKFVLSLILFTIRMSKEINDNFIIYDDPISSFDEKRRFQILQLIQNNLKNKTVLILSHDNVFVKYALSIHNKKVIGNIDYFSNIHDNIDFINISKDDFVNMQEAIIEKNKETNNIYLKVMNIRMQYEDNHRKNIYKYLSGITHLLDDYEFQSELIKCNIDEDKMLEMVKEKFNIVLPKYKKEHYDNIINVDDLSFFEKCILLRIKLEINETIKVDKIVEEELDNLVHVNDRLYITLNPYKYVFYSEQLYDAVNEIVKNPFTISN